MGSTFGAYSIAVSGMSVSKAGLAVTSNNLSNVNTTGFSRQRLVNAEQNSSQTGGITVGVGADVQEIQRIRNQFLDRTYQQQNAKSGYWDAKSSNLEEMQQVMNDFSSTDGTSNDGLQQSVTDFFNAWEELAKDPSSQSNRATVKEDADNLIDKVTQIDSYLEKMQQASCNQVDDAVDQVNSYAQQVATLNGQIMQAEQSGAEASDLRDQRDTLVDKMSALVNISTYEQANGVFEVSIGGVSFVDGEKTHQLTVSGDGSTQNPLQVQWKQLAENANITGGGILAYMEDADQSGVEDIASTDIPYSFAAGNSSSMSNLRQGLNDLIVTIADKVNELHCSGKDLNGNAGLDFFIAADSTKPLSSGNIEVNPALDDPNKIVAAASGESGDNTIANQIYDLTSSKNFQYDGLAMDANSFYQSLVSWLGTAGDNANRLSDTQSNLVKQVDTQRQSLSSVSMDEEMSNMIVYQNAYSASARVLSTIDSLLANMMDELS